MERNCTNCRHFRATIEGAIAQDFGECRAHPPAVLTIEDELTSAFPAVTVEDDCGEWRAAQ